MTSCDLADSSLVRFDLRAFGNCASLTDVRFPHGLEEVSNWTFSGCTRLVRPELPTGVTRLSVGVFHACTSLAERLDFPYVEAIANNASNPPFKDCTGGVMEIHFPAASKESIIDSKPYKADPTLGTGTATCLFDL